MIITDVLLGEHNILRLLLQQIGQSMPAVDSISTLQNRVVAFAFALESHANIEDELLFTALEPHLGAQSGPLMVMRMEHDQITDLLGRIETAANLDEGRAFIAQMTQVVQGHFQKEEQALFRMARQFLSEEELASLGAQLARKRAPLIQLD